MKNQSYEDLDEFQVTSKGVKLTENVLDLKIYQDAFSPFMNAELQLFDSEQLIRNIKIGDTVQVKMKTKQNKETDGAFLMGFVITNILNRFDEKERSVGYSLILNDKGLQKDLTSRVTEAFTDKESAQVLQDLMQKCSGTLHKSYREPPKNKISYIAPNVSPLTALYTILRATAPKRDYLFFCGDTSLYGNPKYYLLSLSDMEDKPAEITFSQQLSNAMTYQGNHNLHFAHLHFEGEKDTLYTMAGLHGASVNVFSVSDKKFTTYGDNQANIMYISKIDKVFDEGVSLNESVETWALEAKKAMLTPTLTSVMFSTHGFCKSHSLLGENIYIKYLDHDIKNRAYNEDKDFKQQKFFVTAVTHHVNAAKKYRNSFRASAWQVRQNS